jgi:hypothetical protein
LQFPNEFIKVPSKKRTFLKNDRLIPNDIARTALQEDGGVSVPEEEENF